MITAMAMLGLVVLFFVVLIVVWAIQKGATGG
jgi:hypothetical protein